MNAQAERAREVGSRLSSMANLPTTKLAEPLKPTNAKVSFGTQFRVLVSAGVASRLNGSFEGYVVREGQRLIVCIRSTPSV